MQIEQIFPSVLRRLLAIYRGERFELLTTVQPVSIVDSDIILPATANPTTIDVPFTAGDLVAPVAGTIMADTLAQAEGIYDVLWTAASNDAGFILFQRRNAANAADIWFTRHRCATTEPSAGTYQALRVQLRLNERLRLVVETNAAGATTYRGNIWIRQVS